MDKKLKCKYTHTDSTTKTCGFRRPDGKEYILDIPNEALTRDRVVGSDNPSAPINVWIRSMEDSLTTRYYRDLTLDELMNIKRDQVTCINGLWFAFDYLDGYVEVYVIKDYGYHTGGNLISKKSLDLGLIKVDA